MAATRLIAMHISKGWTIQDSIKAKTDYAENPEKTEGKELVSSYACSTEAVAEEFLLSYNFGAMPREERLRTWRTESFHGMTFILTDQAMRYRIEEKIPGTNNLVMFHEL